jgi:hypothetical protein
MPLADLWGRLAGYEGEQQLVGFCSAVGSGGMEQNATPDGRGNGSPFPR